MNGYDPTFLGVDLPPPTFTIDLESELVEGGKIFHYPNYSVIHNGHIDKRSPAIVMLNIDQSKYYKVGGGKWRIDPRMSEKHQLNNDYYYKNPWDRGHMARRATAAWGDTKSEALIRSKETYYYTNAALQHENLNQDEWLDVLEEWVKNLQIAKDNKISSMSGPIYGDYDRTIRPSGRAMALVPAGFFKVVCFINKSTNQLDVRAFVMYQDEEALKDKDGAKKYNNQHYQVTISEIEALTGLIFDSAIYKANPLIASAENIAPSSNITRVPERIEVAKAEDIVNEYSAPREHVLDDEIEVYIAAALINPEGPDKNREWISIVNLGEVEVDISDWVLVDNSDNALRLSTSGQIVLSPGESFVVKSFYPNIQLSNQGDVIRLYNEQGSRVDWVNYSKDNVVDGKVTLFVTPRDMLKNE